jgi:hypothetical protein
MSFNQFTNLDFGDLRTQIKDYLRANQNFTDFDFEGSNFSVLIDLLAYNSYITAYNTNMAVNEVFLESATLRENVVSLARNIGYLPRSRRSARSNVNFTVDMSQTNARTVKLLAGQVALGAATNGNYIFSIPEDTITPVNSDGIAIFDNLPIYEGIFLTSTFVVDGSQTNQRFILPNINIDTTSIRVKVTNAVTEVYSVYDNLLNLNKNNRFFLIQEVEDAKYEIRFGDNIIGKKPENGSKIEISYIVTNGSSGNGATNFTFSGRLKDNNLFDITVGISLLTTQSKSESGDEIESVDSIKYFSPKVFASQYRAVTSNDYKALIPYVYPNVESVNAYGGDELDPPEYGKVFISIKPRNGTFLSEITKKTILNTIKKYSIAGIRPEIIDLSYLYIELDISAYYNANLSGNPETIKTRIVDTLTEYSNSKDVNSFGGRFKYSKVIGLIDDCDKSITSNITKVKMRRDLNPEINSFATYELCFGNKMHTRDGGYSVKSTGFYINGVLSDLLYMSDRPSSINKDTGTIFFFKLENNLPVIVKNNAGSIDYVLGEIKLDVVNISSSVLSNGFIEIQAIPESNDIIGLKDLYLQLETKTSMVNIVEDVVSSGENSSATQYVTTSSYLNGKYTR